MLLALLAGCGGVHAGTDADAPAELATAPADLTDAPADLTTAPDLAVANDASMPTVTPLIFSCQKPITANACPPVTGTANQASFCLRPQFPGVTKVEVYVDRGGAAGADWKTPFATLTNDGTGTFKATAALPNGSYPYLFRTYGNADGLARPSVFLIDQLNPAFVPSTTGSPTGRSVSQITVPQTPAPLYHVKGVVTWAGLPQPCFAIDLQLGELRTKTGLAISEHGTAMFTETGPDGSYDFLVAAGPFGIDITYPFGLVTGYPNPTTTPSVGITRTAGTVTTADVTLDPADISYPEANYAALTPMAPMVTLPVTFTLDLIPGSSSMTAAVSITIVAGNDPTFWGKFNADTSIPFDGTGITKGKTYWWGAWQRRIGSTGTTWTMESLMFPIVFQ
jgi:hypothetical protein